MFYICSYCAKGQGEKQSTLSLAVAAKINITKYPSRAQDSGTEQRTAQHWLCRMLNSANGQQEYSKMYSALHLLGFRYEQNSHMFVTLNVAHALSSCVSFTKRMQKKEVCGLYCVFKTNTTTNTLNWLHVLFSFSAMRR
jgi:hypothetical protein